MTTKECLSQLSTEDLAHVKEYSESIHPFEVEPSATYEFDGEFRGLDGERIGAEITLSEDHQIKDMFCTCGAGGLCVHLAAMMFDMEERNTLFFSNWLAQQGLDVRARSLTSNESYTVFITRKWNCRGLIFTQERENHVPKRQ